MSTFFSSGSTFGVSLWTLLLSLLECASVLLFTAGCIFYVRITLKAGSRASTVLAAAGALCSLTGGFPCAADKVSRTLFSYKLPVDSTWMMFFVGIAYLLLFVSALLLRGSGKEHAHSGTELLSAATVFPKPVKYASMTAAAIGTVGFYITMYTRAKAVIGKKAWLYLVPVFTSAFLVVSFSVADFSTVWPNIIVQTVNSSGYVAFILANKRYLAALSVSGE